MVEYPWLVCKMWWILLLYCRLYTAWWSVSDGVNTSVEFTICWWASSTSCIPQGDHWTGCISVFRVLQWIDVTCEPICSSSVGITWKNLDTVLCWECSVRSVYVVNVHEHRSDGKFWLLIINIIHHECFLPLLWNIFPCCQTFAAKFTQFAYVFTNKYSIKLLEQMRLWCDVKYILWLFNQTKCGWKFW
jgi:hypothetical protein